MKMHDVVTGGLATAAGILRMLCRSKRSTVKHSQRNRPLLILGNGPSLTETLANDMDEVLKCDTMAVNFAANAPEFTRIAPRYYLLADPHFFENLADPNVERLWNSIGKVDWQMTLLVPARWKGRIQLPTSSLVELEYFNFVAVEGYKWVTDIAYDRQMGMPRPRNVLVPCLMCGIAMGYNEIFIVGADHTWTKTLSVDDDNHVISIQPHFYKEDSREKARIRKDYMNYPLHTILESMSIAFRSYHAINAYASRRGVRIYNATPGSFIDAFPRRPLKPLS